MSHVAYADFLKIRSDGALAFHVAWHARRIVAINYLNNRVVGVKTDVAVVRHQPFSLNDPAAERNRGLLVLGSETDRSHFALELGEHRDWLVFRVEQRT